MDDQIVLQDLIRAKEGLKKAEARKPENEVQELDHKNEIETYKHRIAYLTKMLGGNNASV